MNKPERIERIPRKKGKTPDVTTSLLLGSQPKGLSREEGASAYLLDLSSDGGRVGANHGAVALAEAERFEGSSVQG
jgi:hypothetical protein